MFKTFKLTDGYALNTLDGYSYISNWIDMNNFEFISFSVVFTGGSPAGTIQLQQSNDSQFTGGTPITTKYTSGEWNSSGTSKLVSDIVNIPSGTGQSSATVSGAGSYALNQYLQGARWIRVSYSASSNVVTQLDIFVNAKG